MREEPAGERTRIRCGHRYCHQRVWGPIDPDEGADDTDWCSLEVWTPVSSLNSPCDVEEKHIYLSTNKQGHIKEGMKAFLPPVSRLYEKHPDVLFNSEV